MDQHLQNLNQDRMLVEKYTDFQLTKGKEKINSSDNHAVGYSFSSDFQSQNIPQSFSGKNS